MTLQAHCLNRLNVVLRTRQREKGNLSLRRYQPRKISELVDAFSTSAILAETPGTGNQF